MHDRIGAVVTADWHADAVTAGVERYDEIEASATSAVEHAIAASRIRPTFFVFAGDLTNPDPPRCWRAARLACRLAARLEASGVPSLWITGNHDVLEDGRASHSLMPIDSRPHDDVAVVAQPRVWWPYSRVGVLCLPYAPRSHQYDPAAHVASVGSSNIAADIRLIVAHLMLEGIAVGSETKDFARGRDVFFPLDAARQYFPGVPIVNGHYHAGQTYRDVLIPGSLARLTVAEAGNTPRYLEVEL